MEETGVDEIREEEDETLVEQWETKCGAHSFKSENCDLHFACSWRELFPHKTHAWRFAILAKTINTRSAKWWLRKNPHLLDKALEFLLPFVHEDCLEKYNRVPELVVLRNRLRKGVFVAHGTLEEIDFIVQARATQAKKEAKARAVKEKRVAREKAVCAAEEYAKAKVVVQKRSAEVARLQFEVQVLKKVLSEKQALLDKSHEDVLDALAHVQVVGHQLLVHAAFGLGSNE